MAIDDKMMKKQFQGAKAGRGAEVNLNEVGTTYAATQARKAHIAGQRAKARGAFASKLQEMGKEDWKQNRVSTTPSVEELPAMLLPDEPGYEEDDVMDA